MYRIEMQLKLLAWCVKRRENSADIYEKEGRKKKEGWKVIEDSPLIT